MTFCVAVVRVGDVGDDGDDGDGDDDYGGCGDGFGSVNNEGNEVRFLSH